jgi:4a-hydroxytetrahydrobiopterin dehydratase
MTDLASREIQRDRTAQALSQEEVHELLADLPGWTIEDGRLSRDMQLKNFKAALALVNEVGELAETSNHHPDLTIHRWNHVRVEWYTHSVEGLSINDFIMAARVSALLETRQQEPKT